ncbi:MAG: peptide deformylase [Saprospiraceae bacterium]|nr:peptide deformylase [Saprospiraceae bacterium]
MILPIYAYGHEVLKKEGAVIDADYPEFKELLDNMWETMYAAKGVGLAAQQIGLAIKLFIVDTVQIEKEDKDHVGIKRAFINATILEETGEEWSYEEGCLSIPDIHADVMRKPVITVRYMEEDFVEKTETFDGLNARVIQHEYDHTMGKLFIEKINPLKRRLLGRRLENIRKGKIESDYRMRFGRIK